MRLRAETRPWTARRVFLASLLILCIALAAGLLYRFAAVWIGLFLAIVVATALRPAVTWLEGHGLSRFASASLTYGAVCAIGSGLVAIVVPPVVDEVVAFVGRFPSFASRAAELLSEFRMPIVRETGRALGRSLLRFARETPLGSVTESLAWARSIGRGTLTAISIALLGYFWLLDGDAIVRRLLLLVPLHQREVARDVAAKAEVRLGAYVRGQALLCVIVGCLAFAAYAAMGLPYAAVLAVSAGVFEALPVIGPWLGAMPALLVALATEPVLAIWVLAATGAIHLLEAYVLFPRVMARTIGMNPMVTLLAILGFWSLLGILGALLAIPIAAVVQLLLEEVLRRKAARAAGPERDETGALRLEASALLAEARRVRHEDAAASDAPDRIDGLESLAADLERLVATASTVREEPP